MSASGEEPILITVSLSLRSHGHDHDDGGEIEGNYETFGK